MLLSICTQSTTTEQKKKKQCYTQIVSFLLKIIYIVAIIYCFCYIYLWLKLTNGLFVSIT